MKGIVILGYLLVLSVQDIYQQKVSLWLLLLAIIGSGGYAITQQRGWNMFLDVLPGILLCVLAFLAPKALGIGDGVVGIIYGLFYGGLRTCVCYMLAFLFITIAGVVWCIGKAGKTLRIPFIPFFTVAHVVMQL